WLGWKIFRNKALQPGPVITWAGIILAAVLFGMGHLPMLFASIAEVSNFSIFYIIVANMLLGVPAGWLFWKKGLEAAIIAHIFGHVILIILGQ
ncbi:MAG: CPBP family glutamic-type intramembrane protease, partial [Saprospiraceae bacterium]